MVLHADRTKLAVNAAGSTEKLNVMPYPVTQHSVETFVAEMVATIGENMTVRRTSALSVKKGAIGSYVHNQIAPGMGKIVDKVA